VLIASAVPFIQADLARHMSYARAMSISALTVFLLAGTIAALGREKHGVVFGASP
jgi:hypothetical protein